MSNKLHACMQRAFYRSRPLLEPEKRTARFLFQGRGTRERSHAQKRSFEHGEHPPLETGFLMVLGLDQSKGGASDKRFCFW